MDADVAHLCQYFFLQWKNLKYKISKKLKENSENFSKILKKIEIINNSKSENYIIIINFLKFIEILKIFKNKKILKFKK